MNDQTTTGAALEASLTELTKDLVFISETDAPVEVVSFNDIAEAQNAPDNAGTTLTELNFDEFKEMYGTEADWQSDGRRNFARKFGAALDLIHTNLKNIKILRLGDARATVYVIGQGTDNRWHGLKTQIVET